jgi:hypothetical protein
VREAPFRRLTAAAIAALVLGSEGARADDAGSLTDDRILDASALRVESMSMRVSALDQHGHGYQSQAGPLLGPGNERITVFEPQTEIVFSQGSRVTHRLWVPIDVVTAASPNALRPADVTSGASRHVESLTIDWTTTYAVNKSLQVSLRDAAHVEQPFRSWATSMGMRQSFADDATVFAASASYVFDWFDRYDIVGEGLGHASRHGTTGSLSLTQVLTPTTLVSVNYGLTVLEGVLGNTWNSVPLATGVRGGEILPAQRTRHAVVGRASQWLPWNGALRGYARFYADDWGIAAASVEGELLQRLSRDVYLGAYYRFHTQTGAFFFTTLAPDDGTERVADSDLAPLQSSTVGGKIVLDLPRIGGARAAHFDLAVERYVRSNDLQITIVSCGTGLRF